MSLLRGNIEGNLNNKFDFIKGKYHYKDLPEIFLVISYSVQIIAYLHSLSIMKDLKLGLFPEELDRNPDPLLSLQFSHNIKNIKIVETVASWLSPADKSGINTLWFIFSNIFKTSNFNFYSDVFKFLNLLFSNHIKVAALKLVELGFAKKALNHNINSIWFSWRDWFNQSMYFGESFYPDRDSEFREDFINAYDLKVNMNLFNKNFIAHTSNMIPNKIFFDFSFYKIVLPKPTIVTLPLLHQAADKFWSINLSNLNIWKVNNANWVTLQIKFRSASGEWRTVGEFSSYLFYDFYKWKDFIENWWLLHAENYQDENWIVSEFVISFKFINSNSENNHLLLMNAPLQSIYHKLRDFNRWLAVVPPVWALEEILFANKVLSNNKNVYFVKDILLNFSSILSDNPQVLLVLASAVKMAFMGFPIDNVFKGVVNSMAKVHVLNDTFRRVTFFAKNTFQVLTEFTDEVLEKRNGFVLKFKRSFDDGSSVVITDNKANEIRYFQKEKDVYISKRDKVNAKDLENIYFGTYDIETKAVNEINDKGQSVSVVTPVSIAVYIDNYLKSDKHSKFWFITDYKDNDTHKAYELMMIDFLIYIEQFALQNQNNVKTLYMYGHNAARFDLIFFIKQLLLRITEDNDIYLINVLKRNAKLLAVDWKIRSGNGRFVNGNAINSYINIRFMDSILITLMPLEKAAKQFKVKTLKGKFDFNRINEAVTTEDFLDLKEDLMIYNMDDCVALWEVLHVYANILVNNFNVNMFSKPTAASIAFDTYKVNFLKDEYKIPVTSNHLYNLLKPAYLGGAVDVFKPRNPVNTKVYCYDINSEYPAMMAQNLMPTGIYEHFIGPVDFMNPDYCGFVRAHIKSPENLLVPLLNVKVNNRMVAPLGEWTSIYYAAELRYAAQLGYQIAPIEGWTYTGRAIFKEFIDFLFGERLKTSKDNPMNFVFKILMNSTYGRFGMAPVLDKVMIIDKEGESPISNGSMIEEIVEIDNSHALVAMIVPANMNLSNRFGIQDQVDISLPVAAAITAHARICIHTYKLLAARNNSLLYSDTDSVMTSKPFPEELTGKDLGMMKLEYVGDAGIFLAPKVYAVKNPVEPIKGSNGNLILGYYCSGDAISEIGIDQNISYSNTNFKIAKPLKDIFKAKGLPRDDHMLWEDYERLLNVNEVFSTINEKWFRNMNHASINIVNMPNTVRVSSSKRSIITDRNNKFIDTAPFIIFGNKIVSSPIVKITPPVIMDTVKPFCADPECALSQVLKVALDYNLLENKLAKLDDNEKLYAFGRQFAFDYLPPVLHDGSVINLLPNMDKNQIDILPLIDDSESLIPQELALIKEQAILEGYKARISEANARIEEARRLPQANEELEKIEILKAQSHERIEIAKAQSHERIEIAKAHAQAQPQSHERIEIAKLEVEKARLLHEAAKAQTPSTELTPGKIATVEELYTPSRASLRGWAMSIKDWLLEKALAVERAKAIIAEEEKARPQLPASIEVIKSSAQIQLEIEIKEREIAVKERDLALKERELAHEARALQVQLTRLRLAELANIPTHSSDDNNDDEGGTPPSSPSAPSTPSVPSAPSPSSSAPSAPSAPTTAPLAPVAPVTLSNVAANASLSEDLFEGIKVKEEDDMSPISDDSTLLEDKMNYPSPLLSSNSDENLYREEDQNVSESQPKDHELSVEEGKANKVVERWEAHEPKPRTSREFRSYIPSDEPLLTIKGKPYYLFNIPAQTQDYVSWVMSQFKWKSAEAIASFRKELYLKVIIMIHNGINPVLRDIMMLSEELLLEHDNKDYWYRQAGFSEGAQMRMNLAMDKALQDEKDSKGKDLLANAVFSDTSQDPELSNNDLSNDSEINILSSEEGKEKNESMMRSARKITREEIIKENEEISRKKVEALKGKSTEEIKSAIRSAKIMANKHKTTARDYYGRIKLLDKSDGKYLLYKASADKAWGDVKILTRFIDLANEYLRSEEHLRFEKELEGIYEEEDPVIFHLSEDDQRNSLLTKDQISSLEIPNIKKTILYSLHDGKWVVEEFNRYIEVEAKEKFYIQLIKITPLWDKTKLEEYNRLFKENFNLSKSYKVLLDEAIKEFGLNPAKAWEIIEDAVSLTLNMKLEEEKSFKTWKAQQEENRRETAARLERSLKSSAAKPRNIKKTRLEIKTELALEAAKKADQDSKDLQEYTSNLLSKKSKKGAGHAASSVQVSNIKTKEKSKPKKQVARTKAQSLKKRGKGKGK